MRWLPVILLLALPFQQTGVHAFISRGHLAQQVHPIQNHGNPPLQSAGDGIEPYVGPVGSIVDMEGGIALGE